MIKFRAITAPKDISSPIALWTLTRPIRPLTALRSSERAFPMPRYTFLTAHVRASDIRHKDLALLWRSKSTSRDLQSQVNRPLRKLEALAWRSQSMLLRQTLQKNDYSKCDEGRPLNAVPSITRSVWIEILAEVAQKFFSPLFAATDRRRSEAGAEFFANDAAPLEWGKYKSREQRSGKTNSGESWAEKNEAGRAGSF